jgi:hypothetical protein
MDARNELAEFPSHHNERPEDLPEILVDETAALQARADALLDSAGRAFASDRDTAEQAALLVAMMKDHGEAIEAARVARKQPHLDAGRIIDQHFAVLRTPLVGADAKRLGGEALRIRRMIDDFYDEEEKKAEAERSRIAEAARQKQEAAEAAERERLAAEEAARNAVLDGDVRKALTQSGARVDAEVRQRQLAGDARRLAEQAAQITVAPINTGFGVSAPRRTNRKAVITNLTLALKHARKINEAAIREAVQSIYDRQVRAGVRLLPGAEIVEERTTQIRRG